MSSVMSLFDAFLVMIVCIIIAGVMIVAFAVPADNIDSTLSSSAAYTDVSSGWKNDASKDLLLVANRLISVLLIIVGIGNFLLTAVRRQEVQDVYSNGFQYQGRY